MEQAWRLIPPDAAKPLVSALKKGDYLRAERMAVELVRKHPFDAQGWVYLGESLLHLGYGEAASQVFERAWLLDPQAAWTDKISRLLRGLPKGEKRADIDELLRVPEVSVAAGILARDEERAIARCLDSLQDAVDQIVLIDTGSTDRTLEIASRYEKVQIVHFDWCDDFSAARNEGLNHMDAGLGVMGGRG